MDAIEMIKGRRSIRKFSEEAVSHEVIEKIVSAAAYAPSWKNTQITRYHVIETADLKNTIATDGVLGFEFNTKTITRCPALVVVSYKKGRCGYERDGSFTTSKEDRWQNFDAGIATQTFCLAAHEAGVGSVILGIFDDKKVAEIINLPEDEEVAALVAIGYPAIEPEAPARKEVAELVSFQ